MSSGHDDRGGARDPENGVNDYDQIQKRLGEGFDGDPRLESGVPQDQLGSDIEFIQMSGLVRPSAPPVASTPAPSDDLDASRPVSFFEKGVEDVDAEMAPGLVDDRAAAEIDAQPIERTKSAMSHLREIIDDLTKDVPAPNTDPALMAALDTPEVSIALPPAPADMHDDVAPAAVAVSTSELPPAPEAPVSLDDVLAELGSSHPMHDGAAADIAAETIETVFDEPAPVVPHETPHEAEAFAEAPRPVRPAPELPSPAARLEEVERLLDDLGPETAAPIEEAPGVRRAEADEIPDEALDFKRQGKRRHRSTDKNPVLSSLVRLAAGLLVTSGLAVATYAGYLWIHQRMASPDQLFNQAARLVTKGEYAAASRMFEEFAALHPADPMRAEAQFNAAFAMQLQKPADSDTAQEVTSEALRLFDQYRKDNPTHAKAARAQTIMGRLNYEAGKYADAVELLRDPELRLRDPASAVPALRTLARASAKMGDAESARSYYLQAVGVQGNHSPDVDYAELGSLYQTHADKTEDLDKRIELQQLAIESWAHALEAPGIDPSNKQAIRSQLDVLRERLQNEPGMAPAMESLGDADAPVDDSAHAVAEPAAPGGDVAPAPASETPVSTPETQMTPADAGEYVVQHGDTLTSIAEAHHVTLDALVELNALKGDTVFEGQHLLLPQAAPADKESTS